MGLGRAPSARHRRSTLSLARPLEETLDVLARRWKGAGPLLPAFALLGRGRPVGVAEIAAATGAESERIEGALASARCTRDDGGRIVDLYGMTLHPTRIRLEIGTATTFSCCALWAHTIPRLVGRTARVESEDPVSGEPVRLTVSPNGVESVETRGAVGVLAVADAQAIASDVGAAFCSHTRHFASRATAEPFAAERPCRHVVDLGQLDEAARLLLQAILTASAS